MLHSHRCPRMLDEFLACPVHRTPLTRSGEYFLCTADCRYPVVQGVPFLLPRDITHTHRGISDRSFATAEAIRSGASIGGDRPPAGHVDAWVQEDIAATNSNLYRAVKGSLSGYPIPDIPLEPARPGARLLDIGCGWGRWCIAAARRGFLPVGIDPSLESVLAGQRVAAQLGVKAFFVVGDSRYLPFRPNVFDAAFSYSVLQHFAQHDVRATLSSLAPTLRPDATTKLHLLNRYGLRSIQVQLFRLFREARDFETRYWSPSEMLRCFSIDIGPSALEIDGFFVQGRYEDRHLFRPHHRLLVECSHTLTSMARWLPLLKNIADNVFVVSRRIAPSADQG